MPSAQAQAHNPDEDPTAPAGERGTGGAAQADAPPIDLSDVDRLLAESVRASQAGSEAPVRDWRDDLSVALAALLYAEAVLSADAAVLRHCLASPPLDHKDLVDELPTILTTEACESGERRPSDPAVLDAALVLDPAVIGRADPLVAAHEEMATVDLTEPRGVGEVLEVLDAQLAEVVGRRHAVEARLGDIRAAIIRHYRDGAVPTAERWLH